MKYIRLFTFILSLIILGCNERKTEKIFSTTVDTGTDMVDTTLLERDSSLQEDTIPTKLPPKNSDTETVLKPKSKDNMPVAKPDTLKKRKK
ncbi:hypothetical protein MYP_468 [Sporocytophaga myxococcoides]|uniref:Lipoprotein n=1 Tax=Sporocytophaga myxococcoides TaxID=153721 RepID=A0A098LA12_9BACT|nr:hypothetical protein [Sporocytophaga myxococcoides]GAL83242.1 hypothetical protein MYP_468 [Sporocytophaga myxococcoides]